MIWLILIIWSWVGALLFIPASFYLQRKGREPGFNLLAVSALFGPVVFLAMFITGVTDRKIP